MTRLHTCVPLPEPGPPRTNTIFRLVFGTAKPALARWIGCRCHILAEFNCVILSRRWKGSSCKAITDLTGAFLESVAEAQSACEEDVAKVATPAAARPAPKLNLDQITCTSGVQVSTCCKSHAVRPATWLQSAAVFRGSQAGSRTCWLPNDPVSDCEVAAGEP